MCKVAEGKDLLQSQVAQPPVDAVSEFRLQTHTYAVSFGRNTGSVVNATRSAQAHR